VKKVAPGKDPAGLIIKYIRTGVDRYNSGSWNIMAGYEDAGFAKYVSEREDQYNSAVASEAEMIQVASLKDIKNFRLPNGDLTDIGHMFGTMDISYTNVNSINHADVAGWSGDLVDLLSLSDQFGVTGTLDEMMEEIASDYFLKDSFPEEPIEGTFSQSDFYGDLDGFYVMQQLTSQEYESGLIYKILNEYFDEELTDRDRAEYLLKNRLGDASSLDDIRAAVYSAYTGNSMIATLEGTREFTSSNLSDLRRACCYVFADYLCELAGDYVERNENIYYTVFSSEKSTLAPGVTQQINIAHTADKKQIRYYIATADINSKYVDVYANYHANDPSQGWAMATVMDQALAAQENNRHIPNYTVVASTNGAGYNMQTGEPGGLLVMGGVEYHAPNANGFFGILKDGSAIIGTTEEYNALKAEGKVMEGIAGFGAALHEQIKVRGGKGLGDGCRLDHGAVFRDGHEHVVSDISILGIAASAQKGADLVPHLPVVLGLLAHLHDGTGDLKAHPLGTAGRRRIIAFPLHQIRTVQSCLNFHETIFRAADRIGHIVPS